MRMLCRLGWHKPWERRDDACRQTYVYACPACGHALMEMPYRWEAAMGLRAYVEMRASVLDVAARFIFPPRRYFYLRVWLWQQRLPWFIRPFCDFVTHEMVFRDPIPSEALPRLVKPTGNVQRATREATRANRRAAKASSRFWKAMGGVKL